MPLRTGAIKYLYRVFHNGLPNPMVQLTVFRREYLESHRLRFVPGLKFEDVEFSDRALFWAKTVVPTNEPYYLYRFQRIGSIVSTTTGTKIGLSHYARVLKSLFAFHSHVSKQPGFDAQITKCWGHFWITNLFKYWFSEYYITQVPRAHRLETLKVLFADGFDDFDAIVKAANFKRRIATCFIRLFVKHPALAWVSEMFFHRVYYPLIGMRRK